MMEQQRHHRIRSMIAAHVLLGLGMGVVARSAPGWDWPIWQAIWYLGLLCSEALLLGVWVGLSGARGWIKLLGLAGGICWLSCLSFAPAPPLQLSDVLAVAAMHGFAVLGVALCFSVCRSRIANLERRIAWEPRPVVEELQFSLGSLVALTGTVALLLALGRLIQWLDQGTSNIVLVVLVFALLALLASALLVWSCLGQGRVIVRGPTMFLGMAALGLVFPYYLGGPTWRFLLWPALMALIAICAGGSLLVVRSCGYRIVPRRQQVDLLTVSAAREPPDA